MESSHSVQAQKVLLRNELRRKREALGRGECKRRSEEIIRQLLAHPRFKSAHTILAYVATGREVETRPFLEEALRGGKKVYLPRVIDTLQKEFAAVEMKSLDELRPGSYGILEPPAGPERRARPDNLDLVVVPGAGFDRAGGRLGRGEGYFDRFLEKAKQAYKIGLAYECQMVDEVPREANDMRVNEVLIG